MTPTANVERVPPPASPPLSFGLAVRIIAVALGFRVAAAAMGFLATVVFPAHTDQGFSVFAQPHPFWDTFAKFDSGWYYGIASGGYTFVEGGRNNLAFFPLYPSLMGGLGQLLGGRQEHFYLAGIVVSWASFALACVQLYKLASLDLDRPAAARAVVYAAIFPSAYFFGVVYSESLFFLLLVTSALALRQREWILAGAAMAALTATRVNGVMFLPALAVLAWQASGSDRRARRRGLTAVAAGLLGIGGYSVYNHVLTGDPVEWFHSIQRWDYHPGGNPLAALASIGRALLWRPVQFLGEAMAPYDTVNALSAAGVLALTPLVWRRFGAGYALMIVLGLALPLSSGQFEGLGRYGSVLFPVSIALGSLQGEFRHMALMTVMAMLFGLCLSLFVNAHPLF